ncbi:MAG: CpsD/CapB family tyrosine-protein kinase [Anaerolineae bacterium]|nr:CpsD/CapB family tyrosine-protein kinase [Anaerolineae bacterium]MDW8173653.1 CpsD/CapB family tyrosine-protein kinase [Anaerolineae bacterium]
MATPDLITLTQPRSAAAEAYRALRTNLMFTGVEKPIQTLVVASAASDDGKSQAVANLAVTFAQAGHATILVDGDMRQPKQHKLWGVENKGLATMMLENAALHNPPLLRTTVDNLFLLPAGERPPNPADLLSSKRMSDIIAILKAKATYILFDAPPVLAATDAALLALKTDAALLVVQAGRTRRDDVMRARQALEQVNVRIAGAVLTHAPREKSKVY